MVDNLSESTVERKKRLLGVDFLIRLVKEKPLGAVGGIITLLLLLTGIFANFLAPYGASEITGDFLAPPSAKYWLGTDNIGRDLLTLVIFGARISVIIGLAATTLSTLISTFIGVLSGYIGGKLDLIVQRFVDAWMCLPWLPVLMVIMSVVGPGMLSLIIVLGLLGAIGSSRLSRSVVISVKEEVYVQAAVAIGCPTSRILTRHILPNIMAPVIIQFSTSVPAVILTEASLSFLGFGLPPATPSWGGMLGGSSRAYMYISPWLVIWPGLALAIVVYGINMFGDAVRDLLDPKMRGGAGRYGMSAKEGVKKVFKSTVLGPR